MQAIFVINFTNILNKYIAKLDGVIIAHSLFHVASE